MRIKLAYILIGILLLSVVAMEWRQVTEGFQTVAPPASIKCTSSTRFGRKIWLCEDGNHSKALLAGAGLQKYVGSGDQVCTKKDKDTNPPIYACQDWERMRGERELRTQIVSDHSDLCDRIVSAYWEFTDTLVPLDEANKILKDALDQHTAAETVVTAYRDRTTDAAIKSDLARLRLDFLATRPAIQTQYNSLNTQMTESLNPRNFLREAAEHYKCKLD